MGLNLDRRILRWLLTRVFVEGTRTYALCTRNWELINKTAFIGTLILYLPFCLLSWLRLMIRKLLSLKPAVLWAPTPIINIVDNSKVLRRLGYPSTTLVFATYYITKEFDINLEDVIQKNPAINHWLPNLLFLWSLLRFDIYHFFYDGGLWSGMKIIPHAKWIELPLLRLAGKRIIASAYGADVRMKYHNEKWQPHNICQECPEPGKHCVCSNDGEINAKYHRDWCNALLAMGDMHDFVFDSRVDFVYWPIDTEAVKYVGATAKPGPVRIVHSPNHPHFKGTRFIRAAVEELQKKGYDLELVVVQGVSNVEAKRRYAEADIVIAQCLAGWIGYTEVEGMAMGKPVMTYLRSPKYLAHAPGAPLVSASPDTLVQELEKLVSDAALREEVGRRSREYVERYWSYDAVAPKFAALHQEVWKHNHLFRTLWRKWRDFFRGESRYRVGKRLYGSRLGEWPVYSDPNLNMRRIEQGIYGQPPFNGHGLPRVFYNGDYVEHPGAISLFALNAFQILLRHPDDRVQKERFSSAARWLAEKLVVDERGVGRWFYNFKAVGRNMPVPWVSCFSQGVALSIVLRAEQLFAGQGFLDSARKAVGLFRVPVDEGGVLLRKEGLTFLEEYPEDPPSHVLNGFMTAVFGLHEYWRVTGEAWVESLIAECVNTLRQILPRYETGEGIRYDLLTVNTVNADYYYFQVQQLRALWKITGDPCFEEWAKRWRKNMFHLKWNNFVQGKAPL